MEPKTRQHLDRADRNRNIAYELLDPSGNVQPAAFEWAAVVAFYSAVHLVNAYCWETHRVELLDHRSRSAEVRSHFDRGVALSYWRLTDFGWQARYDPKFRLGGSDAQDVLNIDLEAVRRVVLKAF